MISEFSFVNSPGVFTAPSSGRLMIAASSVQSVEMSDNSGRAWHSMGGFRNGILPIRSGEKIRMCFSETPEKIQFMPD